MPTNDQKQAEPLPGRSQACDDGHEWGIAGLRGSYAVDECAVCGLLELRSVDASRRPYG